MTILFRFEKVIASEFLMFSFIGSFILYAVVYYITPRVGKKNMILFGFLLFSIAFLLCFFIPVWPFSKQLLYFLLIVLAAFPLAVFGILPNVIIADTVNRREKQTGKSQAGMYFGVRNFTSKLGISLANLIFPSLLIFGYTTESNMGIRYTCLAAFVFCIIGMLSFIPYKDLEA